MNSKNTFKYSILAIVLLLLGVFIIFIHSFYQSYYVLYGKKLDNMFNEQVPENTTNTVPVKSKSEIENSFWESYVNPLNLSFNNPKTNTYSIKNDYYTYVDKDIKINDNLVLHYKVPENATINDDYNIDINDMSMKLKINIEKIEDAKEFENYTYDIFLPEYINKRFQKIYGDNVLLREKKQVKVFDYYYYEVYTRDYYTTYFVIVQNGYIISLNTRTSIEEYEGTFDKLSEFLSYIYLTSYVEVK